MGRRKKSAPKIVTTNNNNNGSSSSSSSSVVTETPTIAAESDHSSSSSSSSSPLSNGKANNTAQECDLVIQHLLACSTVPKDSVAIQTAIQALKQHTRSNTTKTTNGNNHQHPPKQRNHKTNVAAAAASVDVKVVMTDPATTTTTRKLKDQTNHEMYWFAVLFRSLLVDFPLWLLFVLLVSTVLVHWSFHGYYVPQMRLMAWDWESRGDLELTYYERECTADDITANDTAQLLLSTEATPDQCAQHMAVHGASMYAHVLQPATANAVRSYMVERNAQEQDEFWVIEGTKRKSFGLSVHDHPSIRQALHEIATHPQLRPALDQITGPNPAVIEFTGITSMYGAADQFYHQDVVPKGSSFKYARNFVPSYTLFIALQDTTHDMGATDVCPGTHVCNDGARDLCESMAFRLSGGSKKSRKSSSVWRKGYGALLNQNTIHRGPAHTDRFGGDRVLFILTFAPRPRPFETRLLGYGGSYSIRWDHWGHTLEDFGRARVGHMREPYQTLRSLGLYKPNEEQQQWGWDFPTQASMRIANEDNGYNRDDLEEFCNNGGFAFLPSFLQGLALVESDPEAGWIDFLATTLDLCVRFLLQVNVYTMALYLGILVVGQLVHVVLHRRVATFWGFSSTLVRLVWTHGSTVLVGYLLWNRIESTAWAKNIRTHRLYQSLPSRDVLEQEQEQRLAPQPVPSTLPFDSDILVDTRYHSLYLASYTNIVRWTHPGNRHYHDVVLPSASFHYLDLTPSLQRQLVAAVAQHVRLQYFGRFLTQTPLAQWVELADPLPRLHHDLAQNDASRPIVGALMDVWDHLRVETRVGYWRNSPSQCRHTRDLLDNLLTTMIGSPTTTATTQSHFCCPALLQDKNATFSTSWSALPLARARVPKSFHGPARQYPLWPNALPPPYAEAEPYPGAWARAGGIVEGQYKGKFNGEGCLLLFCSVCCLLVSPPRRCFVSLSNYTQNGIEPKC